jgi:hypothetical protein
VPAKLAHEIVDLPETQMDDGIEAVGLEFGYALQMNVRNLEHIGLSLAVHVAGEQSKYGNGEQDDENQAANERLEFFFSCRSRSRMAENGATSEGVRVLR